MTMTVKVDAHEVIDALEDLEPRAAHKTVERALKKVGNFLAGKARAAAPSRPRKMKSKTRARNAKRDKPGSVVSARHALSPIVQHGTRDRFTRSGAFRGRIEANPFITRTADEWGDEALDKVDDEIAKALEL